MYNAEQKNAFFRDNDHWGNATRKKMRLYFERISQLEEKFGKDVCRFDESQVREVAKLISGYLLNQTNVQWLRWYANWCAEQGFAEAGSPLSMIVSEVDTNRYVRSMVSGPKDLEAMLDKFLDPISMGTIDVVNRCAFWLAFCGVDPQHIDKITSEHIDLENMVICYEGFEFPIYQEALKTIQKSMEITEFRYFHPKYSRDIIRKRDGGLELIRGFEGSKCSLTRVKDTVKRSIMDVEARLGVDLNIKISFDHIFYSGIFSRAYEHELKSGFAPSFAADIEIMMVLDDIILPRTNKPSSRRAALRRKLDGNYKLWKSVFIEN